MQRIPFSKKGFKASVFFTVILFFTVLSVATTFGDTEEAPVPEVTDIELYDVSELSGEDRYTGGDLVDSGLNETFEVVQQEEIREYRYSFSIENTGDESWEIDEEDELFHNGLNETWSVDRIWYEIEEEKEAGTFEDGEVNWDTSEGGVLEPEEVMNAQYVVETDVERSHLLEQRFLANVTSEETGSEDFQELDVTKLGFLNVDIDQPVDDTTLPADRTFTLNGTLSCDEGECGEVESAPRYNESDAPDTVIPEESGEPFHTEDGNTEECVLGHEEECDLEWSVNATGETESYHLLDIESSSEFEDIEDESSDEREVQINLVIMMDLEWDVVDFGLLDPGEENRSALGNEDEIYNITVGEDANAIDDLWVKSTDLQSEEDDSYSIEAGNISQSFENDPDNLSTSDRLTNTYRSIKSDISPGTVLTSYFWIDVPQGIIRGEYSGTMSFKANSTR